MHIFYFYLAYTLCNSLIYVYIIYNKFSINVNQNVNASTNTSKLGFLKNLIRKHEINRASNTAQDYYNLGATKTSEAIDDSEKKTSKVVDDARLHSNQALDSTAKTYDVSKNSTKDVSNNFSKNLIYKHLH